MTVVLLAALLALPPVFPVSEVQRGQKGECQTVFEGDTIEPFTFEVKGVMRHFLGPNKDLVLVRLLGEKPNFTGVVAGMSGSPCTINGRLLGALSYAFAVFAKEPIAGITPIDSMLDIMRLPAENRPWRIARDGIGTDADWDAMRTGTAVARVDASADGPKPIATPLTIGGVPPHVREHFDPWLRAAGFEPMAGGASSGGGKPAEMLTPGGSIAAVLIRGDVDVAATGTVTYVDGNTVLAFGHPFFGAGAVSIPMANAEILNTMASSMRSFKMSATGATLGEITQDRLTAIGGYMGGNPSLIPIKGSITTPKGTSQFNFEVARDLVMSPRLVAMGLSGALSGRADVGERGTVHMQGEIVAEGAPPVIVRNVYSAQRDGSLMTNAAIEMARNFGAMWETPFGPPPKMSLSISATLDTDPIEEWIEAIHLDRSQVRPGETVEVAVRLRRQDGPATLERFHLTVPRSWRGQPIELFALGVDGAERVARELSGNPKPTELSQVARYLNGRRADGNVYLMAIRAGAGVHASVDNLAFLPPSVVALVADEPNKQSRAQGLAWEERRARPGVVSGQVRTSIQVLAY